MSQRLATPLTLEEADALRRGLPVPPARAYLATVTTDELHARLMALLHGASARLQGDRDLLPGTVQDLKAPLQEALRILFLLGVEQQPRVDYAGPMPIPFSGCATDNRAKTCINAEADRLDRGTTQEPA